MAGGVWHQRRGADFGGTRAVWTNSRARSFAGYGSWREFEGRIWNRSAGESDDSAADGGTRRSAIAAGVRSDRESDCGQSVSWRDAGGGLSRQMFRARVRKIQLSR